MKSDQKQKRIQDTIKHENLTDKKIDEASHFILRLSYCQNEELRRWFLQYESALFQHRLSVLTESQLANAVQLYAQLTPIKKEQKERMKEPLLQLLNPTEFLTEKIYAVPFAQALDLIATRQCYLKAGYAYVPHSKVVSIVVAKFRTHLARTLALMANSTAAFWDQKDAPEATRVTPLLQHMHRSMVDEQQPASHTLGRQLTANTVVDSVPNMPLCMRQLHSGLQQDKKLKHQGRLQYGFFLRSTGLSQEECLLFFQRHFKKVTGEQFQKQYAPIIKHMYKERGNGSKGYSGYGCSKIISFPPPAGQGEHHGCPYKTYDSRHLSSLMQRLQIGSPEDRRVIMQLKEDHQYQLACQKHFDSMHPDAISKETPMDNLGNHPNAWFKASIHYHEKLAETGEEVNAVQTVSP